MLEVTYTVHIEPCREGGYVAHFPALPGCFTQGESLEEVITMAKDALGGYLESLQSHGEPIPAEMPDTRLKVFEFPLSASLAR